MFDWPAKMNTFTGFGVALPLTLDVAMAATKKTSATVLMFMVHVSFARFKRDGGR